MGTTGHADPDKTFAVKTVPRALLRSDRLVRQMEREVEILRSLRHPHIVEMHFDFQDKSKWYLGMEYIKHGSMFDLLFDCRIFPLDCAALYFYQMCDALEYLHNLPQKVIHRDIKPENILMESLEHAKLADFGWSNILAVLNGQRTTFCGTPDYLAPEMVNHSGHNESLDMWEMGVLLFEMVLGESPFIASNPKATANRIVNVDLRFDKNVNPDAKNLIESLCRFCPDERLTAAGAKTHPFVQKNLENGKTLRRSRSSAAPIDNNVLQLLKAKSAIEQSMVGVDLELTELRNTLRQERRRREKAEQTYSKLLDKQAKLDQEIVGLLRDKALVSSSLLTVEDSWAVTENGSFMR